MHENKEKKNTLGKELKLSKQVILFKNIIVTLYDDFSSYIATIDHCIYVGIVCLPVSSSLCYMTYNSVLESMVFVDKS